MPPTEPNHDESRPPLGTRFLRALAVFGPLMVAAVLIGDMSLAGIGITLAIAAVIVGLIVVWDRQTQADRSR